MPNLDLIQWIVLGVGGIALLFMWGPGALSWVASKVPAGNSVKQVSDTPTAQDAFAAVQTLANYIAKCKDDPAYVGVKAATKAQLEAP